MKILILLLSAVMRAADVTAGIEAGYSNIRQETVAGATVLESGSVPTWIDGELDFPLRPDQDFRSQNKDSANSMYMYLFYSNIGSVMQKGRVMTFK